MMAEVGDILGIEGYKPDAEGVCILESEEAEIRIKYEGYIRRQKQHVEQFAKMEGRLLPEDCDYSEIYGLRIEARQKLNKIKPKSLGQASRISGVSPSDISVLVIWLESRKNR